MKESMVKVLDFFKKNKFGRVGVVVLFAVLIVSGILFFNQTPGEKPVPLSQVAEAVSAGQVTKIEDSPERGAATIYYKDGSEKTTRRDLSSSLLEQLKLLGVSESQLLHLRYEIVEP